MIVSTSLIRKRDDISLEQFRRHWLDPHGPLTAKLPGTRRYDQNHVLPSGLGTNAVAHKMRIDGFPVLAFDDAESRRRAHGSLEMAACNLDSRGFIGAVARVISDDGGNCEPADAASFIKQLFMVPNAGPPEIDLKNVLAGLDGVAGSVVHRITEQGSAPNSTVPFIGVEVQAFAEVWIVDIDAVDRNARRLGDVFPQIATFQIEVVRFL